MFRPDFQVDYYALDTEESTLAKVLQTQMQYEFFPVSFCDLQARSAFHTFTSRNTGTVKLDVPDTEGTSVTAIRLHKHEPRAAYRLNCNGKVIVYAVNVDWGHAYPSLDRLASFVSGADLLITNIPREHEGWRSSDDERAFVQLYRRAHIARTVVSDFSPSLDDNTITAYIQRTREQVSSIDSNHNQRIQAAYTNLRIIL